MKITSKALQCAATLLDQFADFINEYLDENGIQDFINDPEFATVLASRFSESAAGNKAIEATVAEILETAK